MAGDREECGKWESRTSSKPELGGAVQVNFCLLLGRKELGFNGKVRTRRHLRGERLCRETGLFVKRV